MNRNQADILYLGPKGVPRPVLRTLFAAGVGGVFGFQTWRLAKLGFSLSPAWYGTAAAIVAYLLLGCIIGATARGKRSWLHGVFLGLIFSLLIALSAIALGLKWMPHGVAVLISGTVAGFLIALITQEVFPQQGVPADHHFLFRDR
jgi:peptidoglycan/LPS O-acetylase OafA/YrhL